MVDRRTVRVVATAGALVLAATAGADDLTVEQAVALALRDNRQVGNAALDVRRAEERVEASRTHRLPSLEVQGLAGATLTPISMTFPAGSFGTFPGVGPIPSEEAVVEGSRSLSGTVTATLAQPVTGLKRINLATKLEQIGREAEVQELRSARSSLAGQVRRAGYELLQAQGALAAAEDRVRLYEELDHVAAVRVSTEAVLQADALDVKAHLAAEQYKLAALKGDVASGRERLNHLMGRALTDEWTLQAEEPDQLEELELPAALARAEQQRPDLAQARLSIDQAETRVRLKAAESIPELNLAVTYATFVNVDLVPRNVAQAGVQVKWEPFDWGRRGREKAERQLGVVQARNSARETASAARMEVTRAFRELSQARLLVAAETAGRDAAAERLRVTAARHRVASAVLGDVLQAQAAMSEADARHQQALMTFWTARADLRVALGEEK